jgi:hypothetical protein
MLDSDSTGSWIRLHTVDFARHNEFVEIEQVVYLSKWLVGVTFNNQQIS